MDGLTIMILITSFALVMTVAKAVQLVVMEIIEDIAERRRICRRRRRRGYRRGYTHARSTEMWREHR